MPDRIVRAEILTSEPVNALGWGAEVFYRRLFSIVDDYGRYDGRPSLLRAHLYPMKLDRVSEPDVGKWLTECVNAGLVRCYVVSGRPYVEVLKFGQRVRADKSKWPDPPTSADICQQPLSDAAVFVFEDVVVDVIDKAQAPAPRKRSASFDAKGLELPRWLDFDLWCRWVDDRKARKKPITEAAAKLQLSQLDEYRQAGATPKECIEHSIASGYQGLFPPKKPLSAMPGMATVTVPSNSYEETQRMLAEERARWERVKAERAARKAAQEQGTQA